MVNRTYGKNWAQQLIIQSNEYGIESKPLKSREGLDQHSDFCTWSERRRNFLLSMGNPIERGEEAGQSERKEFGMTRHSNATHLKRKKNS